ncbi:MAG: GtrA family protein [Clostridia bacterium]
MKKNNISGTKRSIIQFIKFMLIGVINTLIDLAVFTILRLVFNVGEDQAWLLTVFQAISFSCGVLNSYLFNTLWTFKEEHKKKSKKEFWLFVLVNIGSFLVSVLVLYLSRAFIFEGTQLAQNVANGAVFGIKLEYSQTVDILSKLVATPIAMIVNFFGNKLFVFKDKSSGDSTDMRKN